MAPDLFHSEFTHPIAVLDASCDMGGDDDIVELPELTVECRRFRVGDVQEGEDPTGLQFLDQCSLVDQTAASSVDDDCQKSS